MLNFSGTKFTLGFSDPELGFSILDYVKILVCVSKSGFGILGYLKFSTFRYHVKEFLLYLTTMV